MFALIHSPLVGPMTWRGCAAELERRGHHVAIPSLAGVFEQGGTDFYGRLTRRAAEAVNVAQPAEPVVLVAHRGAGSLLRAIGALLDSSVAGAIFVDAMLPHPGASFLDTAPPVVAEQLVGLARDGRLPAWDRWFPLGVLDALLPDAEVREAFTADLSEVPLAYFEEPVPKAEAWGLIPCAYLRLSPPYEEAAGQAEHLGWPVVRLDADHLAMVTQPEVVACHLEALIEAIGNVPRR